MQEPPEEAPPATEPGPDPLPDTEPGPPPPPATDPPAEMPDPDPEPTLPPVGEPEVALSDAPVEAVLRAPESIAELQVAPVEEAEAAKLPLEAEAEPEPDAHELAALAARKPSGPPLQAHWLLSLFTPAAADAVDWGRGSYTVLARGGRIDSPSGSGELKKQIQMVAEGSVLYADGVPRGAAADVAPDGFAHPVFRAGFALSIRLPEVH
jgi:hypothetical protein